MKAIRSDISQTKTRLSIAWCNIDKLVKAIETLHGAAEQTTLLSTMKEEPGVSEKITTPHNPPKRRFWESFGGTSLSISMLVHVILLVLGLYIVMDVVKLPEKKVDFMPPSGGGGSPSSDTISQKQRARMTQPSMSRVAAMDVTSNLVLPAPDEISQMSSLSSGISSSLSSGLGGGGSGGGRGEGNGPGFGSGFASGMSDGKGMKNPFGIIDGKGALTGSLYDLKQNRNREPIEMDNSRYHEAVQRLVKGGFRESLLREYYKAPQELSQTMLHIPKMPADLAPAAFECQNEVQPRQWIVIYRGNVQAPKSGKFRFVGAADDLLVVRFNNRTVFDFGYTHASIGQQLINRSGELDGTTENKELAKEMRKSSPMELPIRFYRYQSTPTFNNHIGGYAVGPEFEVKAGKTYPVEILIGELPGGFFGGSLLIEEVGVEYEKDAAGSPVLPLFRVDHSSPSDQTQGEAPPFAPTGPVWKFVPGSVRNDI